MNSTKNKKEEKSLQMLSYTEVEKKKKTNMIILDMFNEIAIF